MESKAIKEYGNDVLIVASSDMTHYESATAARKKDDLALGEVLALNAEGLLRTCRNETITMWCNPGSDHDFAARELGATRARLVQYSTSGDVTGDNEQVVAYAAVLYLKLLLFGILMTCSTLSMDSSSWMSKSFRFSDNPIIVRFIPVD
jgi:AmmeMemoRadiSam system protein B